MSIVGYYIWNDRIHEVSTRRYVRFHSVNTLGENQSLLEKCLGKS